MLHNTFPPKSFSAPKSLTAMLMQVLQPLCWCCVECVIHQERDEFKEQHHIYVAQTSNNIA